MFIHLQIHSLISVFTRSKLLSSCTLQAATGHLQCARPFEAQTGSARDGKAGRAGRNLGG